MLPNQPYHIHHFFHNACPKYICFHQNSLEEVGAVSELVCICIFCNKFEVSILNFSKYQIVADWYYASDYLAHISGSPSSVDPLFYNCQLTWLWSFTCALKGFFWLLSHVIYLKLTKVLKECFLSQTEWWVVKVLFLSLRAEAWTFWKLNFVNPLRFTSHQKKLRKLFTF